MVKRIESVAAESLVDGSLTNLHRHVNQAEIDFGSYPVESGEFTVIDTQILPSSHITGTVAYEAPTGKDLDELDMDSIDLKFAPGNGTLLIKARGLEGYLHGAFKVNYMVG